MAVSVGVFHDDLSGTVEPIEALRIGRDESALAMCHGQFDRLGESDVTNGESPGRVASRTHRASNRPESLRASVAGQGEGPPGSNPLRTRTWNPLQIPRINPPRS